MNMHIREALLQIHEIDSKMSEMQLAIGSMQRATSIQKNTLLQLQGDIEKDLSNTESNNLFKCDHITDEQLQKELKEMNEK